jgi:hypothetical protein
MIRYVHHSDIDTRQWDACIAAAANSLIYGYSFYLNNMAPGWDALVLNDYEAVMPLVWRKKYGVKYLYQPAFTQQLGIFSRMPLNSERVAAFVNTVKKTFRFAEIFTNIAYGEAQPNYVLPLTNKYSDIQQHYSNDLLKNLKVAQKQLLQYVTANTTEQAIALYRQLYSHRITQVSEQDYRNFSALCNYCEINNRLFVRSVTGPENTLLAMALFFKNEKRIYNILSSVTENGKKCSANHWLFDQLVQEFSGKEMVLDFEGSAIPGIKKFYENFGPHNEPYYFMRYNNLPAPLSWFKQKSNC